MPIFTEKAGADRDLRIQPSFANPLPRLTPLPTASTNEEKQYEVVVIGAGPAGLFLTTLLARYGLSDDSLLCVDSRPGSVKAGQADGLQPRTLEVLQSLNLAHEILTDSCHMTEVAFWNPKKGEETAEFPNVSSEIQNGCIGNGIERTSFVPDVVVPARYQHEVTIHQGRIERILEEDLARYSKHGIVRSTEFQRFELDEASNPEFPLRITLKNLAAEADSQSAYTIRAKHLVGADGAHSSVRNGMGLQLKGETTDHIWGVMDFVAATDFPDVRKRCAIHSDSGSVMIIPRERIPSGRYLTRLYVQMIDDVPTNITETTEELAKPKALSRTLSKELRAAINQDFILDRAQKVMWPYHMSIKKGTEVDWWAAYQIGQRMVPQFSMKDPSGLERVFIVGDACHTHSPKAGQGMNVSMMDSYNLSWKLVHSLHGLTPRTRTGSASVLGTFNSERVTIAKQLIEFDTKFSSMFSGKIGSGEEHGLSHEEFLKVFSDGNGFTSGCGIEYPESIIVIQSPENESWETPLNQGIDHLTGYLRPGRRLIDCIVKRYADSSIRHIHDEMPSDGRYRIIVFAASDFTSSRNPSASFMKEVFENIVPEFPQGLVQIIIMFPGSGKRVEWDDFPPFVKEEAEMTTYIASKEVYAMYGIEPEEGASVVVRPDGYVGKVSAIKSEGTLEYLRNCLVSVTS